MRLPIENSKLFLPSNRCQRLFIQAWYSRVHAASLDTYRVRSLDSLAIADEILDSLGNSNVPLYRTKSSCEEAVQLLGKDFVLHTGWKEATERALSALTVALRSKDENTTCPDYLSLAYHLRRLKSSASAGYRGQVIHALEVALGDEDFATINDLTSRLLTRLVNEGYSLEGLFGIVANVLIRHTQTDSFSRSFDTIKNKVLAGDAEFQVILRLIGPSKALPDKIGNIDFAQEPFGVTTGRPDSEFYQEGSRRYFARVTVFAREERSAGEEARRSIERVMDALRFELIHDLISVHDEFICVSNSKPAMMFRFPSTVPNPKRNIYQTEFAEFLDRLAGLYTSDRFPAETKSKVGSALHYYRLSLDTNQLQNRLVNSWTALEYLARDRTEKYILNGVKNNVVSLLVIPYLRTLLANFRETFTAVRSELPLGIAAAYSVSSYHELSLEQLLESIRGPHFLQMELNCYQYPALQLSLCQFQQGVCDNKATAKYLAAHKQNIEWHLTRLYGARNDIVHSADTSTRLTLLCANLEYYVKLSLQEVIDVASAYEDINSLDEIFAVQRQAMALLLSDLENGKDGILKASLQGAIC